MKMTDTKSQTFKKAFIWEMFIKHDLFHSKMIYLFFCMILFFPFVNTAGQNLQSSKDSTSIIEEKLVALALEGPAYKGADHQNKINEYQLKSAKNSWLNLLTVSTNYNDQSFKGENIGNTSYVYPKYFFGVTIPLGTLFSRTGVKSAKEQVEISKDNQEQLARNIRADIISKYRQYKNYSILIALQSQAVDDEETAFLQAKEKFRNGDIAIEAHNAAQKLYNDELVKKIGLQLQQDLLKIEIERIIGTTLENALK